MTEHLVVHYKDEVKANNALDNLRLVTNSQNSQLGHFSRKPAEYDIKYLCTSTVRWYRRAFEWAGFRFLQPGRAPTYKHPGRGVLF